MEPSAENRELINCLRKVHSEIGWDLGELVEFLKAVGIMNPGGKMYGEREKKLYEVIHFSSHIVKCVENISRRREVVLLDCGCGRSYLPFFVNYVLGKKRRQIDYIGIDSNPELVKRSTEISKKLGFFNMRFYESNIISFEPEQPVNIVCALHACDTATDEAIAKGIRLSSRFILAAPCCQRQVVKQVSRVSRKVPQIKPLVEAKVTKEYIGVALTETLRKLALESFGYKVDLFEFVSSKYTPKNIMLRAEKIREWNWKSLAAYQALRDYFAVKPKIQEYLKQLQ